MQGKTKISRRAFLKVGAGLLGAAGLTACAAPAQLSAPPASTAADVPVQVPATSKAKLR